MPTPSQPPLTDPATGLPVPAQNGLPTNVPEFAERHDDPAQAEELERQQDA